MLSSALLIVSEILHGTISCLDIAWCWHQVFVALLTGLGFTTWFLASHLTPAPPASAILSPLYALLSAFAVSKTCIDGGMTAFTQVYPRWRYPVVPNGPYLWLKCYKWPHPMVVLPWLPRAFAFFSHAIIAYGLLALVCKHFGWYSSLFVGFGAWCDRTLHPDLPSYPTIPAPAPFTWHLCLLWLLFGFRLLSFRLRILCTWFLAFLGWCRRPVRGRAPRVHDVRRQRHAAVRQNRRLLKRLASLPALAMALPTITSSQTTDVVGALSHLGHGAGLLPTYALAAPDLHAVRQRLGDISSALLGLANPAAFTIIPDTGASQASTFSMNDFLPDTYKAFEEPKTMQGIAGGLEVKGEGRVSWEVITQDGAIKRLETRAYYIPGLTQRLFSPQDFLHDNVLEQGGCLHVFHSHMELDFADGTRLCQNYDPVSRLPIVAAFHDANAAAKDVLQSCQGTVFQEENSNLSRAQKALLLWHCKLGHTAFNIVKWLARESFLGEGLQFLGSTDAPICASCQFGKGHRQGTHGNLHVTNPVTEGVLSDSVLQAGQNVAMDQYECSQRGRLEHTKGREPDSSKYVGGTLFYDIATRRIFIRHQTTLAALETIRSKHMFE